jgi:hypothetical protein
MNAIHFNSISKIPKNKVVKLSINNSNHSSINLVSNDEDEIKLLFCTKGNCLTLYKERSNKIEQILTINLEVGDEILETLIIESKNIVILTGKNSKKIVFYEVNFIQLISAEKYEAKIIHTFQHIKKITNVQYFCNDDLKDYLIYSDKFGEIFVLDIELHLSLAKKGIKENLIEKNSDEDNEVKSAYPTYMMYGHSDSVSFLLLNKDNIISSDCLGKIKICEFPNIYEIKTVLLYENYFYLNTISENYLLVINNNSNINLWNLKTLKLDLDKNIFSDCHVEFSLNTNNFSFIDVVGEYLVISLKNDSKDRLFVFKLQIKNEVDLVLIKQIEDEKLTKSDILNTTVNNQLVVKLINDNELKNVVIS